MESEKLIEEVRKFPVLYDQSDEKYRNAEYKERVWKIITETLKAPGGSEECRKMWASIRDQFRRTLHKRKTKSGQAAAKKQRYKYEDVLEFLLPHIVERETLSNVPSMEDQSDNSELETSVAQPKHDPESELVSQNDVLQYPGTSSQTTVEPTSPVPLAESMQAIPGKNKNFAMPFNVKRRGPNNEKPAQQSPSSQLMAFILAEKEAEKSKVSATNSQHPVELFLAGLAPILKSLDPVLLNQAKTVIFTTVQEFELKQLLKNESHEQMTNPLSLPTMNHASFSRGTGSNDSSSHSEFTNESPQRHSPNESHQQMTNPLSLPTMNHASFSRGTGTNDSSSHSEFTNESSQRHSPNESHQQMTNPLSLPTMNHASFSRGTGTNDSSSHSEFTNESPQHNYPNVGFPTTFFKM